MATYYGFIYIWFDTKRKMFYLGSHKGNINDGYICSNQRMNSAYARRPQDFKRRILKYVIGEGSQTAVNRDNQRKLLQEEQKWLNCIKPVELGTKYYNLKASAAGGHKPGVPCSDFCKSQSSLANAGKKMSLETVAKMRISNSGRRYPNRNPISPEAYKKSSISKILNAHPTFDPDQIYTFVHTDHGEFTGSVFDLKEQFSHLLTNSLIRIIEGEFKATCGWSLK